MIIVYLVLYNIILTIIFFCLFLQLMMASERVKVHYCIYHTNWRSILVFKNNNFNEFVALMFHKIDYAKELLNL